MAVDSGASATVISEDMIPAVPMTGGRSGVMYEIADGTRIPNMGEKCFKAHTEGGLIKKMRADVADVNKALLSVSQVVKAGSKVLFAPDGSYIQDSSGECIPLKESNGMYMLSLWVKAGDASVSPF